MFKYFCLLIIVLCSCNQTKKESNVIRVSVLRGPSAIAFAQWMEKAPVIDGKTISVELIDSPDLMQAIMIKGETDLAVLPMISAANLYNKGIRFTLLGCPVWGTLYLVGRKDTRNDKNKVLHIFGAGTTPDILTRYYLAQHNLDYTLNYSLATAREVMQGLLAGKVETAVLGEPFLSMALHKDSTLQILADLNNPGNQATGFPQTAILLNASFSRKREQMDHLLTESCLFATGQPEEAIRILEEKGVFKSGMLSPDGIERSKIQYIPAKEITENILQLLQLINQYEPKAIGGKLPDEEFITGKQ